MTTASYTYQVQYSNGERTDEYATEDEAREAVNAKYGDETVIHDEWESAGGDSERLLVWENESDADNDAGQNAVASIVRREE